MKDKDRDKSSHQDGSAKDRIVWHQGFYGGIELELRRWKKELIFDKEHELTKEPLIADMLIIRKTGSAEIDNPIGRIFRGHNMVEFKSPSDTLSMDGFCKALSYALLYKSQGERENAIKLPDMTLSIFCVHLPKKLFGYLPKLGVTLTRVSAGIYHVDGMLPMAIQIIVIRELPGETHSALRIMRPKADAEDIRKFLEDVKGLEEKGDRRNASAVLRVSMAANAELYIHLDEGGLFMGFEDVMRHFFPDYEENRAKVLEEGRAEGIAEVIMNMLRNHEPIGKITQYTQFSAERINEIARSIGVQPTP